MSPDDTISLLHQVRATRLRSRGLRYIAQHLAARRNRAGERIWAALELVKMNRRDLCESFGICRLSIARVRRRLQAGSQSVCP